MQKKKRDLGAEFGEGGDENRNDGWEVVKGQVEKYVRKTDQPIKKKKEWENPREKPKRGGLVGTKPVRKYKAKGILPKSSIPTTLGK